MYECLLFARHYFRHWDAAVTKTLNQFFPDDCTVIQSGLTFRPRAATTNALCKRCKLLNFFVQVCLTIK